MELVICLSPGPWQAVFMAACLRKIHSDSFLSTNRIVLLNLVKDQQKQLLKANSQLFDELQLWSESYSFEISGQGLDIAKFENFLNLNNLREANQLILRSTTFRGDKVMACLQRKANLVITEDGAHTWFETDSVLPSKRQSSTFSFKLKESAKTSITDIYGINLRVLPSPDSSRYSHKFSAFPEKIRTDVVGPNWKEVTKEDLSCTVKAVNHNHKLQLDSEKVVVFLGGNLSEGRYLWPDEEYGLYYKYITELIGLGFEVWYKPHPRANKVYSEYLNLKINSPKFLLFDDDSALPIECLVSWTNRHIVVGAISSALWYLEKIFGVQCFTIIDEYYYLLMSSRSSLISKITLETLNDIPHVEKLLLSVRSI